MRSEHTFKPLAQNSAILSLCQLLSNKHENTKTRNETLPIQYFNIFHHVHQEIPLISVRIRKLFHTPTTFLALPAVPVLG